MSFNGNHMFYSLEKRLYVYVLTLLVVSGVVRFGRVIRQLQFTNVE